VSLESSLATVTDSIDLLKSEIEREEALLAKETKQLQEMEKNANRAEAERKRQMKNVSTLEWFWHRTCRSSF
jgi:kinetochore protein Fta7